MAKLKGPLFSLGASQQIGKALVYFPWKGLNVVREHVIPANPNTTGQQTQRGYLTDAVAAIHTAQGLTDHPLWALDIAAYALYGSTFPTPRTWFNTIVKNWLDQHVDGLKGGIFYHAFITPGVDLVYVRMWMAGDSVNGITAGAIWYGTSKTALVNSISCTGAELVAGKDVVGLTTGVRYYFQYRPTVHADWLGVRSGIYYAVAG